LIEIQNATKEVMANVTFDRKAVVFKNGSPGIERNIYQGSLRMLLRGLRGWLRWVDFHGVKTEVKKQVQKRLMENDLNKLRLLSFVHMMVCVQ
jgi:hypothetical protein